jgi:hypothetical protein
VDVAPRLFLRELVDVLDRIDQHPAYDPHQNYKLKVDEAELTPQELAARKGTPWVDPVESEDEGPPVTPAPTRRLDG